jgi:Spy/CpxP family protein refolding chaperone
MVCGLILGAVGGLAAFGIARRMRGGGCGRHGGGRWRRHGAFHLMRELDLDRRQRDELKDLWFELRPAFDAMRGARRNLTDAAVEALAADAFDAARVEAAIGKESQNLEALKQRVIAALGKVHALLTDEQRDKLRAVFEIDPPTAPASPYR